MNKIFIACPFIKYVDGTGFTNESYKKFTEDLYEILYLFFDCPYKHYTFKHFEI